MINENSTRLSMSVIVFYVDTGEIIFEKTYIEPDSNCMVECHRCYMACEKKMNQGIRSIQFNITFNHVY